jgi:hypothetical protein
MVILKRISREFNLIFLIIHHFLLVNNLYVIYMIILMLVDVNEMMVKFIEIFA